ncbi:TPA: ParA family protein, partial [Pseudomonas aeruginosa]
VVSPLQPNMLTAREFNRGTMQMLDGLRPYERLGMRIPKVQIVINCLDQTNDSRAIHENVRAIFDEHQDISVLETTVPDAVVFRNAASRGLPAHRLETRQPSNRTSAPALEIIRNLAIEVFPEWTDRFLALTPEAVA